jgi:hypothetical protein
MVLYLNKCDDGVAIFDATNHTQVRRRDLVEKVSCKLHWFLASWYYVPIYCLWDILFLFNYFLPITLITISHHKYHNMLSRFLSCDPQARRFYGSKYQTTTRYVLCCAALCCVLCCAVCYALLHSTMLYSALFCSATFYSTLCHVLGYGWVFQFDVMWCDKRLRTFHSICHLSCMSIYHNYCTFLSIYLSIYLSVYLHIQHAVTSHNTTTNIPVDIILIKLII